MQKMPKRPAVRYWRLLLPAIAAGVVIAAAAFYTKQANVGSFEYIRKGEDLFNQGRIKESIRYFEKAYASSPDNKDIRSSIVYSYSEYAFKLAGAKDYGAAINYLAKARDIEPNSSAAQNLAIMYSKKAASLIEKSDRAGAKADLERARETASVSEGASRNLSISLYNDAVAYFKKGKDAFAITLLKESLLAYEDGSTLELLGDIYNKRTEFEKAHFYYSKAAAVSSDNAKIREKLAKVAKSMVLAKEEESSQSPHFDLRYEKDMRLDEARLRKILELCYFEVGKDLKYFPDSKTVIFFYSYDNFKNIFRMPSMVRAFYDGNIQIPLPGVISNEEELASYIYHEYTHAAVSAMTNNNCPAWLSEGLAVWEEYKGKEEFISGLLGKSIDENTGFSISALDKEFRFKSGDENMQRLHYLLAYSVVKYIVDNWGIEGVRNILAQIKDGRHVVNAIEDEFLLSEKEFEKRWRQYVLKKYLK